MKDKLYKHISKLIIILFCLQYFLPPLHPIIQVEAEETKIAEEILSNENKSSKANNLEETADSLQKFSFKNLFINGYVNESLSVSFTARKKTNTVHIKLPKQAYIDTVRLPEGWQIEKSEKDLEWIIHTQIALDYFELPLLFENSGKYEVLIEEEKATIEISVKDNPSHLETDESKNIDNENPSEEMEKPSEKSLDSQRNNPTLREPIKELDNISHKDVSNWQEFMEALVDPTVNYINIINDFESADNPTGGIAGISGSTSNPNGGTVFAYVVAAQVSRKLIIEGNNHQIDFRAVSIGFGNSSVNTDSPWDITLQNIEIYHGNWYGPIMYNDLSSGNQTNAKMHYHNVKNVGNQLLHSVLSTVVLSGSVISHQTATYTSKFRTQNINSTTQANFEINQLEILDGASVDLSSINSGNIDLLNANGRLVVGDDADMTLRVTGTGMGEALGANLAVRNGHVIVGNRSKLNFFPQNNFPGITLPGASSRFELSDDSQVNIFSSGRTVSTNGFASNIVFMAGGSTLSVGRRSTFEIDAVNQGTSSSNVIHVAGAANFIVEKEGALDIKSDSTAPGQSLMAFTSPLSTFKFSDARRVNLERTANITGTVATNGLINISGSTGLLDIDIQSVKQWQHGNLSGEPDFSWSPIFNLKINYAGTLSAINNVSSISQEIIDDFQSAFTTRSQRILFEYIPDVEISIDPLSEDPMLESSHVIKGKATPYSVIRFTGDPALPEPQIDSPVQSEVEKYHVKADENGDYRLELEKGKHFTKYNTVKAYAFLNGKFETTETIVEELQEINPRDPLIPEFEVTPENKPNIPENQGFISIDFVSQFNFGSQNISVQDQTYYAQPQKLLNTDGSVKEERPNYIQISDRRSSKNRNGWQLTVTQMHQIKNKNNKELTGASITLKNQQLASSQGEIPPSIKNKDPQELIPGAKTELLRAQGEEGRGTWIYRFGDAKTYGESILLSVPGDATPEVGVYTTTLKWELNAVPDN